MHDAPGTALTIVDMPSPNHGERVGVDRPDMLLLHYTGMANAEVALERLCAPESKVSAHYVVLEGGGIVRCVPEERRAWHAGVSSWQGIDDINSHAIGIEIVNPGHDEGYPDFPTAQIDAVIALARDIVRRQRMVAARVLAHSDVAPQRKRDPGEKFPWKALHAAGIGHWTEPAVIGLPGPRLQAGATGTDVKNLQQDLRRYGYRIDLTGLYDPLTVAVVTAFQRHFRPAQIDGITDASTRKTLDDLLISLSPAVAQK